MNKQSKQELKAYCLTNNKLKEYQLAKRESFLNDDDDLINDFKNNNGYEVWQCCKSLSKCKQDKFNRINARVKLMPRPVFCTLTFTDEVLAKTTEQTRRRYVARFLKENCFTYVANIDYGKENGREHYHAIVDREISAKWKYGFVWLKRISFVQAKNQVKKYVCKYEYHALKSTTIKDGKTPRLIYARNFLK